MIAFSLFLDNKEASEYSCLFFLVKGEKFILEENIYSKDFEVFFKKLEKKYGKMDINSIDYSFASFNSNEIEKEKINELINDFILFFKEKQYDVSDSYYFIDKYNSECDDSFEFAVENIHLKYLNFFN